MASQQNPMLAFNGVIADLDNETLHDGAGHSIPLRPQAFAVLRYLARHPDRLVTKDELMAAVWSGIAVTDDSLVQCVHEIRRAIGDEAHTVLKTVPRRGYRFTPAAGQRRSRRNCMLGIAAAAGLAAALLGAWSFHQGPAPAGKPLVAVLPFAPLVADETSRLLAQGLTQDVITDLTQFPEFDVLARNTTAAYDAPADLREVGRALDARFVIEGSIVRQDNVVRVTVQLIDANAGAQLWSARWDRPIADIFAVQTEIAEQIANRLGGGAGVVQETGRIAARRKPPASLSAYEAYLLGTERLELVTVPDIEAAVHLLNRAVELDHGMARAWIELYHSHNLLALYGVEPEKNRALSAAAAERAVRLDPGDAEAHAVYAMSLGDREDFVRAGAEFDKALRMAPNASEILVFYIGWASSLGEAERGANLVDRAIRLDPNYPGWANRPFAAANFMAGRYDKAVAFFDRLGTEKHNRWSWSAHAGALAALGRGEEADALVAQALAAHPDLSIELIVNEPGWTDAERNRFIETMRLAGFPLCASPDHLSKLGTPRRLPECAANEGRPNL